MSLVTRCPQCGTAFRVQRSQLAAKGGSVRCGKCANVFDGVAGLVDDGDERLALERSPQLGLFDPSARTTAEPVLMRVDDDALPPFLEESTQRRGRWLWIAGAIVAALALALQAGSRYRAEMVAYAPDLRPALRAACGVLGCEVPLPRRPESMSIDSSELQADGRREGLIVLTAVIRNRARITQDYPALELTLTDEGDRPVLRRVLPPRDYLEPGRAAELVSNGIAAGAEASLRVYLDSSRSRATGYRLYLFYPS